MSEIKVNSIKGVAASTAALTINNTDGTCTANLSNRQNRNLIINGAMNVAQRGTSVAVSDGSNEGYQSLDRFKTYTNNSGAYTVSQDTDVPTDYSFGRFKNSYKVDVTTADTSIGSGDLIRVEQDIEAQDIANSGWDYTSSSGKITLSFWVKSVKAGTYVVVIQTVDGTAYSYAVEYTLSANTWTHVTKTIPGNSNLTIDDNNDAGLKIHWILCSGSDNNLTADTWTSGLKYGTTNQVNLFDSTSNNWYLTGVQLEVGSVATDFEHRSFAVEKRLCMRYYQQEVNPQRGGGRAGGTANKGELHPFFFPVEMRSTPTVSLTNTGSSAGQYVYDDDSYANMSSLDSSSANPISCHINYTLSGDLTDGSHLMLGGASSTSHETTYKFNAEL